MPAKTAPAAKPAQTAAAPRSETAIVLAICMLLATAVQVLYAQTAQFEFLTLDDHNFLLYPAAGAQRLELAGAVVALSEAVLMVARRQDARPAFDSMATPIQA